MSTLTTRLGIKKPQDTDPFLTSDFDSNYDLIDSYPGVFICTSTTLPSWGTAQAGQFVMCTDTRDFLEWTGTAWRDPLALPAAWTLSTTINTTITPPVGLNSNTTYTVGTITSTRACAAVVTAALNIQAADVSIDYSVLFNITGSGASLSSSVGGNFTQSARVDASGGGTVGQGSAGSSFPLSIAWTGVLALNAGANVLTANVVVNSDNLLYYISTSTHQAWPITLKDLSLVVHAVNIANP